MATSDKTITDVADDVVGRSARTQKTAEVVASDVVAEVKDDVAIVADKSGNSARSVADSGKDLAADAVHGLADVARQMASKLDSGKLDGGKPDSSNAKAAEYARKAAEGMDRFSTRLREKEVDAVAADARNVVRKNPAIVAGAAALIGFALARFMKGSGSGGRKR